MMTLGIMKLGSFFSMFCGGLSFIQSRKHILNMLLSLEFIMLSVYWMMSLMTTSLGGESYFLLFFLTFAACEGALGLGLLICIVRNYGNNYFSSLSMLT
uniref:NADH dehydrogenase subunit 4L n=1 Tax=Latreutes anoplonyx TaxID=3061097 RepID=UPI00286D4F22|nr:NADH dehydrogenase subunit 4L [Latreutes anoplonyx]WKF54309.1 NADH dehydrogenase subunit 4L [Latreutes anoplonyx]